MRARQLAGEAIFKFWGDKIASSSAVRLIPRNDNGCNSHHNKSQTLPILNNRQQTSNEDNFKVGSNIPPESMVYIILGLTIALLFLVTGSLMNILGKGGYLVSEMMLIFPAMIFLVKYKYSWKRALRLNGISGKLMLISLIIGLAMTVVSDEIDRLISMLYPLPDDIVDAIVQSLIISNIWDLLLIGTGVVIVAGFAEEALFRGFIQRSLEAKRGVTKAVTTASIIFALIHFNSWWIIQILILSMLLGILAWRADSIVPGIIIHAVNNALGLWSANSQIEELPVYSLKGHVSPLVLIPAIILLVWGVKRFFALTEYLHPHTDDDGAGIVEVESR